MQIWHTFIIISSCRRYQTHKQVDLTEDPPWWSTLCWHGLLSLDTAPHSQTCSLLTCYSYTSATLRYSYFCFVLTWEQSHICTGKLILYINKIQLVGEKSTNSCTTRGRHLSFITPFRINLLARCRTLTDLDVPAIPCHKNPPERQLRNRIPNGNPIRKWRQFRCAHAQ